MPTGHGTPRVVASLRAVGSIVVFDLLCCQIDRGESPTPFAAGIFYTILQNCVLSISHTKMTSNSEMVRIVFLGGRRAQPMDGFHMPVHRWCGSGPTAGGSGLYLKLFDLLASPFALWVRMVLGVKCDLLLGSNPVH